MSFNPEVKEQRDELYRIQYAIESFNEYIKLKITPKAYQEMLQQKKIDQEEVIYKLKNGIK